MILTATYTLTHTHPLPPTHTLSPSPHIHTHTLSPSHALTPCTPPPPPHTHTHTYSQVELDELESQLEEYSLTRSFLTLLNALTELPPPATLGAGHRIPGFEPYLEFIRDNVFLRFDSRGYRDANEKVLVSVYLWSAIDSHTLTLTHTHTHTC